jgi:hypothetical protein
MSSLSTSLIASLLEIMVEALLQSASKSRMSYQAPRLCVRINDTQVAFAKVFMSADPAQVTASPIRFDLPQTSARFLKLAPVFEVIDLPMLTQSFPSVTN